MKRLITKHLRLCSILFSINLVAHSARSCLYYFAMNGLQFTNQTAEPMLVHHSSSSSYQNTHDATTFRFSTLFIWNFFFHMQRKSSGTILLIYIYIIQCIMYRNFWLKFIMTADTDFNVNLWKEIPQFSLPRPRDLWKMHLTKLTTLEGFSRDENGIYLHIFYHISYSMWTANSPYTTMI